MEGRFQVTHLRQKELDYELAIRGVFTTRAVDEKRKILTKLLSKESNKPGCLIDMDNYSMPYVDESANITSSLETITTAIIEFEGSVTDSMYKVIKSRINHVIGRVRRMKLPDQNKDIAITFKNESLATALKLESDLTDKASKNSDDPISLDSTLQHLNPIINVPPPVVTYVSSPALLADWPVKFKGDPKTVFTFLEHVTELAQSRKVSEHDLFNSAIELFAGDALAWFRSVKSSVFDWNSLVVRLKSDFLPPHVDDDLWDQIRNRKQKRNESVLIFVAQLEALFSRLSRPSAETTKVRFIRQNLLPEYISQLALEDIDTVARLTSLVKKLEEANYIKSKHSVCEISTSNIQNPQKNIPNSRKTFKNSNYNSKVKSSVKPESLPSSSTVQNVNSQEKKTVVCWNCQLPNHLHQHCTLPKNVFCYRCGYTGVTVSKCPKCKSPKNL